MSKTRTTLAVTMLCIGLLALTALASPVIAKPGEASDGDRPDRRADAQERMENRSADREARHGQMRDAHDAWQACKRENATENVSMQERCGDEKAFFLNSTHARREGRALHGAIAALERRIGRLEAREIALEQQLADGNLSANETAAIQEKIEKIDSHQERMVERLQHLQDRMDALHAKWQSVRDHVAAKRHGGDDSEDESESESESASESSSESASESASESSSESQSSTGA